MSNDFSPREIVSELDKHIVGQLDAKRAVAVALRNRWRRLQLPEALREEVLPKNILMIGPTGCGKTEIARRLARLAGAPFLKVEATKFTEVGYVGRDVESIVRDLVEASINMLRDVQRKEVAAAAQHNAEERLLDVLAGEGAGADTRSKMRRMLRAGDFEQKEIEIGVKETASSPFGEIDLPGMPPGQVINLSELMKGIAGPRQREKRRMTVEAARRVLEKEETEDLLDTDRLTKDAVAHAQNNGIVFIDEIDKIARSSENGVRGGDISREGVQRDLHPAHARGVEAAAAPHHPVAGAAERELLVEGRGAVHQLDGRHREQWRITEEQTEQQLGEDHSASLQSVWRAE